MPQVLADAKIKLAILATKPADPAAPTVTELTAGIDASCALLKSDYRLSATASDTIDEDALCSEGNAVVFGASNYEGTVTPFRYFDATTGQVDTANDEVFQALRVKGSRVWLVQRFSGKRYDEAWEAGDEVQVFEVITDNPQQPSELTGYIKQVVPLGVQRAWLDATVATAGV